MTFYVTINYLHILFSSGQFFTNCSKKHLNVESLKLYMSKPKKHLYKSLDLEISNANIYCPFVRSDNSADTDFFA